MTWTLALIGLAACNKSGDDTGKPPGTNGSPTTPTATTPSTSSSTPTTTPTPSTTPTTPTTPTTYTTPTIDTGTPDTGDTGGPAFDATGDWKGNCTIYGYQVNLELVLSDVAGVVSGNGSLVQPGYPALGLQVTAGSRAVDQVTLRTNVVYGGYHWTGDWLATIVADTMDGTFTLHQGGGYNPVLACSTAR